jgi:hypothetical protein
MNSYYLTATQAIVSEAQLRALFPDSLLPSPLTPTALAESGAEPILESPAPTVTATQSTSINGVVQDSNGNWVWNWVVTDLSTDQVSGVIVAAQATQTATVSAACQAAIYAGFTSSALGSPYTYPAKVTDQQNLTASVLASLLPGIAADWTTPFWCATQPTDGTDPVWAYITHTGTQIQQVGSDAKAAILACLTKNAELAGQIAATTTSVADIQAITWS